MSSFLNLRVLIKCSKKTARMCVHICTCPNVFKCISFFKQSQDTKILLPVQMLKIRNNENVPAAVSCSASNYDLPLLSPSSLSFLSTYKSSPAASIEACTEERCCRYPRYWVWGRGGRRGSHVNSPPQILANCTSLHPPNLPSSCPLFHTHTHAGAIVIVTGVTNALSDEPLLTSTISRGSNLLGFRLSSGQFYRLLCILAYVMTVWHLTPDIGFPGFWPTILQQTAQ